MITGVSDEMKVQLIRNRLSNISRQYFELEMDKLQAQANNSEPDLLRITDRMVQLENAYSAIQALLPTTTTTA